MRIIFFSVALVASLSSNVARAQYDIYIESIVELPESIPQIFPGEFERKTGIGMKDYFYEFSNPSFQIQYYPPYRNDCGFFKFQDRVFLIKGRFDVWEEFGCDLDAETFRVFQLDLNGRSYIILTAIAETSGVGTRDVFCHLFDITVKGNIVHYPLWSLYGSHLSFGDYNNDGGLDFLEVRYDRSKGKNEAFRLQLKTLNRDHNSFEDVANRYILFQREYVNDSIKIKVLEKNW